jgi:3-deoxy-D-manno-octulosonic-acid transferase
MLMYYLYNTLLLLASPLLGLYLLYRRLVAGKEKGAWRERRGLYEVPEGFFAEGKPVIWLHAVSVGEVVAAAPIANAIKAVLDCRLILSTVTPTGREMVSKRGLPADLVVYLPFDLPFFVRRALSSLKPDALVLMESELWYNLVHLAHKRGVPLMLANGRISDRTLRRGARLKWYYRAIYHQLDAILMQSKADVERALAFGAPADKVAIGGNTKFEEPEPEVSPEEAAIWCWSVAARARGKRQSSSPPSSASWPPYRKQDSSLRPGT